MNEELKKLLDAMKKRGVENAHKNEFVEQVVKYISAIGATGQLLEEYIIMSGCIGQNIITKTTIEFAQNKLKDCETLGNEILKLL